MCDVQTLFEVKHTKMQADFRDSGGLPAVVQSDFCIFLQFICILSIAINPEKW
jgi:hypothetical protein